MTADERNSTDPRTIPVLPSAQTPSTRLHRLYQTLIAARADDALQQMRNAGTAVTIVASSIVILLVMLVFPTVEHRIAASISLVANTVAFILNRRGSGVGIRIVIAIMIITNALVVDPLAYSGIDGVTVPHAVLAIPIVVAALLIGPLAATLACTAVIGLHTVIVWQNGTSVAVLARWIFVSTSVFGAITAMVAFAARDLEQLVRQAESEKTDLEREVAARTADLERANAQLRAAAAATEARASARANETTSVVHDVRNHMMTIRAAVDLLLLEARLAGISTVELKEASEVIGKGFAAQRDLLDMFQEAALLDSHALVLQPVPTDLTTLVLQCVERIRPRYVQYQCALVVELPPTALLLTLDPRRIARVLHNLLENALIYTTTGGNTSGRVVVEVLVEPDWAIVRVSDNGTGIAPEKIARVGERFARLALGEGIAEGSGIGLNASMGLIALHGGKFSLTSPGVGLGAVASVALPLTPNLATTP